MFMNYLKLLPRVVLLVLLVNHSAYGRWVKYEDASIEVKSSNHIVNINEDGTYDATTELRVKILKESGRQEFSQYRLTYNENASKISILEAKTIYKGQEYIVSKDMIEEKPLASIGHGFDQLNQITITFPKIELGSEIYLKYKYVEHKVPVDNFFGDVSFWGINGYMQASNTKINSKLPLNIKINDPKKVLEVTTDKDSNFHSATIILKKPVCNQVTNEANNSILNVKHTTWVSLSSLTNWSDLAKQLAPGYIKVLNQPLPPLFESIAKLAAKKDTDEDKINAVTSVLNEKIHYVGDWRTVSGRYFPKDLEQIVTAQIGDCKDFSASTGAILQKLGFKVQPILVMRGIGNFSNPDALPTMGNFNHVMLKVTNKNGKIYWIDPTNFVSMASGIFPDVAGKLALTLDLQEPKYIKVSELSPQDSQIIFRKELIIEKNIVDNHGQINLVGEAASDMTGSKLYKSDQQLRDIVFYMLSGTYLDEEDKKSLKLPDLSSRIVKDLAIQYAFQQKDCIFMTNAGSALTLSHNISDTIRSVPDQISDLFIGVPVTKQTNTIIKDNIIKDCSNLNFEINTPWMYVKRSCQYHKKDTEFTSIMSIKRSLITQEELKTSEYKRLKSNLENKFDRAAIIVSK